MTATNKFKTEFNNASYVSILNLLQLESDAEGPPQDQTVGCAYTINPFRQSFRSTSTVRILFS